MSERIKVYVAGPITKGPLQENVDRARWVGMKLLKAGFAPLVPHLTCFMAKNEPEVLPGDTCIEDWYGVDLPWVAVSDVVLRLPGESKGADLEVAKANELGIPVYDDLEKLIAHPPVKGHPGYHKMLRKIALLHDRKQADYGTGKDPFANVRASEEWGIQAWLGAFVRLNDKVTRIKTFAKTGALANEGVLDSMQDIAVYALIAAVLFSEGTQQSPPEN